MNGWDFNNRIRHLLFDSFIANEKYSFVVYDWYEEMSKAHEKFRLKKSSSEKLPSIRLKAICAADKDLKDVKHIKKGEKCIVHFWHGVFQKWEGCVDSDVGRLSVNDYLLLEFTRSENSREWIMNRIKIVSKMDIGDLK